MGFKDWCENECLRLTGSKGILTLDFYVLNILFCTEYMNISFLFRPASLRTLLGLILVSVVDMLYTLLSVNIFFVCNIYLSRHKHPGILLKATYFGGQNSSG